MRYKRDSIQLDATRIRRHKFQLLSAVITAAPDSRRAK